MKANAQPPTMWHSDLVPIKKRYRIIYKSKADFELMKNSILYNPKSYLIFISIIVLVFFIVKKYVKQPDGNYIFLKEL